MAKQYVNFSPNRLNTLLPPVKGRKYVYDEKTKGLRIQITHKGTKTYQYYSWVKGRGPTTITIGRVLDISIYDARKKANHIDHEIQLSGGNYNKIHTQPVEKTFSDLFDNWFLKKRKSNYRDLINVKSKYNNHIHPSLGAIKVSELNPSLLNNWYSSITEKEKKRGEGRISVTTANHCLDIVASIINQSKECHSNATEHVSRKLEQKRNRVLSDVELEILLTILDDVSTTSVLIRDVIYLAFLTGATKAQILTMEWSDMDLPKGIWFRNDSRKRIGKTEPVVLLPQAIELLNQRKNKYKHNEYVFPNKSGKSHLKDIRRGWELLIKKCDLSGIIFSDLMNIHYCGRQLVKVVDRAL